MSGTIDSQILSDRARAEQASRIAQIGEGINPDYVSLVDDQNPPDYVDGTGVPYGQKPLSNGLIQRLFWDTANPEAGWQDLGSPVPSKAYIDVLAEDSINSTGVGESIISPKFPVQHEENSSNTPLNRLPATVSFVWDRQQEELVSDAGRGGGFPSGGWKSIFDSKGIKFALSVVNSTWDGQPTWGSSQMSLQSALNLQSDGYEIESHIRASDVINANYNEALNVVKTIKETHKALGLNVKNGNWFGGSSSPAYRSAVRRFYRSCATVSGIYFPTKPISQYDLPRITLDQAGLFSYNDWVQIVDENIEKGFPVVFYGHAYVDGLYETKYNDDGDEDVNGEYGWEKIVKLIDYVQAKGGYNDLQNPEAVIITTINDMIDIHGNIIDVGIERRTDPSSVVDEFVRLSRSGEFSSKFTNKLNFIEVGTSNTLLARYSARQKSKGAQSVSVGANAGGDNESDNTTFTGWNAGAGNKGANASFVGWQAGLNNDATGVVAVGSQAGRNNTGNDGVFCGREAGFNNTGNSVLGIGLQAAFDNTANEVVGVGSNACRRNSVINVVGVGVRAMLDNAGVQSTGVGHEAGRDNTGARGNYIGYRAGLGCTGLDTTAIGYEAGRDSSGQRCIYIGKTAGKESTTNDTFIVGNIDVHPNPILKGFMNTGALITGAPASAVADADIGANRMTFYLDEAENKLHVRVKYADGTTIKEGEVALI